MLMNDMSMTVNTYRDASKLYDTCSMKQSSRVRSMHVVMYPDEVVVRFLSGVSCSANKWMSWSLKASSLCTINTIGRQVALSEMHEPSERRYLPVMADGTITHQLCRSFAMQTPLSSSTAWMRARSVLYRRQRKVSTLKAQGSPLAHLFKVMRREFPNRLSRSRNPGETQGPIWNLVILVHAKI